MTLPFVVSGAAFLAIFGGVLGGVWLGRRLPERHLSPESRTAISVSMAVVGTLSALVLSLLISNASSFFNTKAAAMEGLAVDVVKLNHVLVRYGHLTEDTRKMLRTYVVAKTRELSGVNNANVLGAHTLDLLEKVGDAVLDLHPASPRDQRLQARALTLIDAITDARWTLAESSGATIPNAFLIVLTFWLSLLFTSFGLFAPSNHTVLAALLLCALAIAGGIYVILELGSPNSGLIRVSIVPLNEAIQQISGGTSN